MVDDGNDVYMSISLPSVPYFIAADVLKLVMEHVGPTRIHVYYDKPELDEDDRQESKA
jgi:hypothetical protein